MSLSTKLRQVKRLFDSRNWPATVNSDNNYLTLKLRADDNHPWVEILFYEPGNILTARIISAIDVPSGKEYDAVKAVNEENIQSPYFKYVFVKEHNCIDLIYNLLDSVEKNFEDSIVEVALLSLSAMEHVDSIRKELHIESEEGKSCIFASKDTSYKSSSTTENNIIVAQEKIKELCEDFIDDNPGNDYEDISDKLLYGLGINKDETVYLSHDDTVFKTGKDGFAITETGIYCKEMMGSVSYTSYSKLANASRIYFKDRYTIYADDNILAYHTGISKSTREDLLELFEEIHKITIQYDNLW